MRLTSASDTEVRMIMPVGQMSPGAVIALQRRIIGALDAGHARVVVDLGASPGMGGEILTLFCGALRRVGRRRRATVAIAGADPRVRRALELCKIDGLELYPNIGTALATDQVISRGKIVEQSRRSMASAANRSSA